jgi:iron(III) transport system substrate-binding protein
LLANDVAVLAGNATVRDMVAGGAYAWGLTDTDDANGAVEDGLPAKWHFPDQEKGEMGTLVIPNTVALVKNAPNPTAAKAMIDYLLSPEVEKALSEMRGMQIPLDPHVDAPEKVPELQKIRTMEVDFSEVASNMESTATFIREEFVK